MSTSSSTVGYGAVLRVPGLRSVFVAHAASMVGTVAAQVALSILVFERTGSPLLSALVLVCSFVPYALGGIALSSLSDQFPARRAARLLLLTGLVAPIFAGARAASLAQLLDAELFPIGRSLLRAISQVTVLSGFALGAVAVAAIGPTWLLGLDVVTFVASAALIGFGTPFAPATGSSGSTLQDSLTGLKYLRGNRPLRRLILLSWVVLAFSSMPDGLAVAYAAQTGAAATAAGALFAGYSAGGILGELVVARLASATGRRLVIPLILLSQLPAIAFIAEPSIPVAAILLAVSGSGFAFNQGIDPLILAASGPEYRGRLFTIQSSGMMAIQGLSIGLAGAIGTLLRPNLTICLAGLVGTTVTMLLARRALAGRPASTGRQASGSPRSAPSWR